MSLIQYKCIHPLRWRREPYNVPKSRTAKIVHNAGAAETYQAARETKPEPGTGTLGGVSGSRAAMVGRI